MERIISILVSFCFTMLLFVLPKKDHDLVNINKYLLNDCKKYYKRNGIK